MALLPVCRGPVRAFLLELIGSGSIEVPAQKLDVRLGASLGRAYTIVDSWTDR